MGGVLGPAGTRVTGARVPSVPVRMIRGGVEPDVAAEDLVGGAVVGVDGVEVVGVDVVGVDVVRPGLVVGGLEGGVVVVRVVVDVAANVTEGALPSPAVTWQTAPDDAAQPDQWSTFSPFARNVTSVPLG